MKPKRNTSGEDIFEMYLNNAGYQENDDYEYEPELGRGTKIDFIITQKRLAFDVKDFSGTTNQDIALLNTSITGGAIALYPQEIIRAKIDQAKKQFNPYKDDYCCNIILFKGAGIAVRLDAVDLAEAAFGDIILKQVVGTQKPISIFTNNARFQAERNTTFSSICSIEYVRPFLEEARLSFLEKNNITTDDFISKFSQYCKDKSFDIEYIVPRMNAVINPFARIQLDPDFFACQYDNVFTIDRATGKLIPYKIGWPKTKVPASSTT